MLRVEYKKSDKDSISVFEVEQQGKVFTFSYDKGKTKETGTRAEVNDIIKELRKTYEVMAMIGYY